jgi:hypothetical protein
MSVDEARSIGKRLLLSDIPAHREQQPPAADFFDPNSCDELTKKMGRIWTEAIEGPDSDLEANARRDLPLRRRSIAERFVAICRDARAEIGR